MKKANDKPVIAIDIDDVLADSAEGFVAFSNKRWNTNLTVEDYDERWSQMWGVDIEEERRRAHIIYNSNVVGKFRHFEEAKEVLKELKQYYKLVITTSRVRFVEKETLSWIDEHYKGIFEEIHLAGFYDELKPDSHKRTKAELCLSIGASYLIDDHPKHCFAAANVGVKAILFGDYPWSRDLQLPAGITRAGHWHDIRKYFDEERRISV